MTPKKYTKLQIPIFAMVKIVDKKIHYDSPPPEYQKSVTSVSVLVKVLKPRLEGASEIKEVTGQYWQITLFHSAISLGVALEKGKIYEVINADAQVLTGGWNFCVTEIPLSRMVNITCPDQFVRVSTKSYGIPLPKQAIQPLEIEGKIPLSQIPNKAMILDPEYEEYEWV